MYPSDHKTGIALAGGGLAVAGLLSAVAFLTNMKTAVILLVGILLVALVIAGILYLMTRLEKKKKNAQIEGATAGGSEPHTSDANERATLAKLRQQWDDGLRKLKDAGKDLYSMPWVLIVGPSGAGKTEAIRHAELLLKDRKLQDPLAGLGGTLNMNWWFSNDAVLIDTAGRMFLETVKPGQTSEWIEFLKLIKKARPKAPINGVLLVISAASLLVETDAQIASTSEQIAERLEDIKGTLNVRFPVYVMITKSDLIPGFRAFFEDLNDSDLQRQILGWSNPAPLDQPFDHEVVDAHLKTVRDRLVQRRTGLLAEKVAKASGDASVLDSVDELYTFPDAFLKVAPRLRVYMQNIFVRGGWYENSRPFVRGIFFSSAMNQGAQLDKEIADLLNCDPSRVPELGTWEEDRHLFLAHLFSKKILPEGGLVTSAKNVSKRQRMQRTIIFGAVAAGLLLLTGLTVFNYFVFRDSIGQTEKHWADIARRMATADGKSFTPTQLVTDADGVIIKTAKGYEFRDSDLIDLKAGMEDVHPPALFIGSHFGSGDRDKLEQNRKAAQAVILEYVVLRPLIDKSHELFSAPATPDKTPPAVEQLAHYLNGSTKPEDVRAGQAFNSLANLWKQVNESRPGHKGTAAADPEKDLIKRLAAFVLNVEPEKLAPQLRETNARLPDLFPGKGWPPESIATIDNGDVDLLVQPALEKAIASLNAYWNNQIKKGREADNALADLARSLDRLRAAEMRMRDQAGAFRLGLRIDQLANCQLAWAQNYKDWSEAYAGIAAPVKHFENKDSLRAAQHENEDRARQERDAGAETLRKLFDGWNNEHRDTIGVEGKIDAATQSAGITISAELDEGYFARGMDKDRTRLYEMKNNYYKGVNALLSSEFSPLTDNFRTLVKSIDDSCPAGSPASLVNSADTARVSAAVLAQARALQLLQDGVTRLADADGKITEASIRAYIAGKAKDHPPENLPAIPLSSLTGNPCAPDFDPANAEPEIKGIVDFTAIDALAGAISSAPANMPMVVVLKKTPLTQSFGGAVQAQAAYLKAYSDYWGKTVLDSARPSQGPWAAYGAFIASGGVSSKAILPKLGELGAQSEKALARFGLPPTPSVVAGKNTLNIATFPAAADAIVANWAALANRPAAQLRADILSTPDLAKKLLLSPSDTDYVSNYYAWLGIGGFGVLARDCKPAIDAAALDLNTFAARFPFKMGDPKSDTIAEAAKVDQALATISDAAIPVPDNASAELTHAWAIFAGRASLDPSVNDNLSKVRERNTLLGWKGDGVTRAPTLKVTMTVDNALDTNGRPAGNGGYVRMQAHGTGAPLEEEKMLGGKPAPQITLLAGSGVDIYVFTGRVVASQNQNGVALPDLAAPFSVINVLDKNGMQLAIPGDPDHRALKVSAKVEPSN